MIPNFNYNSFADSLGASEGVSYTRNTGNGAYGKYQFIQSTIQRVANYLSEPVPSIAQFISDTSMQDRFYEAYVDMIYNVLVNENILIHVGQPITGQSNGETATINIYGLIAGGWLGGEHAPGNLFNGNYDPPDSNGTHVSDYIEKFSNLFDGSKKKFNNSIVDNSSISDCMSSISSSLLNIETNLIVLKKLLEKNK